MSTNGLKSMFFSQFLGWINQKLWWMSLEFPAFFGEMMENAPFHHDDVFLSSFPYVLGSSKLEAEIGSWIQIAGMVAISPVLNHDWHCLIPWKRGVSLHWEHWNNDFFLQSDKTWAGILDNCHIKESLRSAKSRNHLLTKHIPSWWFQPIWKILVKMGIFPT